jgi:peptide/nickel transport system substrate-binding protein/oligopeptide transport system substrate-binding protein
MVAYKYYAGSPKPRVKSLQFKIYSSTDTAYTDALAGNVDIADVPADKLGAFKSDFGDRWLSRGQGIEFLGFPIFDKPWSNAELRRAISLAIDRGAINKALFGGAYAPADSFLPPLTPGGSPQSCEFCAFEPAKARQLLAAAGGFAGKMVIRYPGGYGLDQEYAAIANQIRQNLGVDAVAQASPTVASYFTDVANRKYTSGPLYSSWSAPYPSAQAILGPNFTEGNADYAGTYYTDPSVTKLLDQGNAAPNADAAIASYHAAEADIEAAFPAAPLFFLTTPMVYSQRVHHVAVDALSNLDYAEITTR